MSLEAEMLRELADMMENPNRVRKKIEDFGEALKTGTDWIEKLDPDDFQAHKEIAQPIYAVFSRALGELTPFPRSQIVKLITILKLAMYAGLAKAYEKGKREALAGLVIEGEVLEPGPDTT